MWLSWLVVVACGPGGVVRGPGATDADDTAPIDTSEAIDTAYVDASEPGDAAADSDPPDTGGDDAATSGACPADMALVDGVVCMDLYEAPNVAGAQPLVMLTFTESEAWCGARGKRLCFDDEWQSACEGTANTAYPYGSTRVPGKCNDEEVWRVYTQSLLSGWPYGLAVSSADTLDELYALARASGSAGTAAADHVAALYQAEGGGTNAGCVGEAGVFDLVGNVEEWTRRRDGGAPDFHGKLKGRYWAESRTCQQGVTTHGDAFRFYEIGFRCCASPQE